MMPKQIGCAPRHREPRAPPHAGHSLWSAAQIPERARLEVAIRNWARKDIEVAARTSAIEKGKSQFIAGVLRDTGFAPDAAEYWSQIVQLACLGWLDRATRSASSQVPGDNLGELLSELILAASARSSTSDR